MALSLVLISIPTLSFSLQLASPPDQVKLVVPMVTSWKEKNSNFTCVRSRPRRANRLSSRHVINFYIIKKINILTFQPSLAMDCVVMCGGATMSNASRLSVLFVLLSRQTDSVVILVRHRALALSPEFAMCSPPSWWCRVLPPIGACPVPA